MWIDFVSIREGINFCGNVQFLKTGEPASGVCLSKTLPTGFVRSHSVVVVSIYNGIEEILQPKLLAKKLLLWEREPKSWYFLVLCGEETTTCGGIWLKW